MKHPILKIEERSPEIYAVSELLLEEFSRLRLWLFDLEATGLDTARERVTQIAGILLADGRIHEDSAFTQFVELEPGVEIPREVQELTGIVPKTLAGAPPFAEAWARHLEAASSADLWIGQSVFEFDVPLLLAEFERRGMPAELPGVLDLGGARDPSAGRARVGRTLEHQPPGQALRRRRLGPAPPRRAG